MSLADVSSGSEVIVGALRCSTDAADRLREVGLRPGIPVRVLQRSVFGAVVIALGFSSLALDRETACSIAVEAL